MRKILHVTISLAALLPLPAVAAPTCFSRVYSPDHLDNNPGQQVAQIRALHIPRINDMPESYDIRVRFRDDTREFSAITYCDDIDGTTTCMIECDGGIVLPTFDQSGRLRLNTEYLRAEYARSAAEEIGCAEPVTRSIADVSPSGDAMPTVFLLHSEEPGLCDWDGR
nr:hypothetical protein [uncultured Devosia sp.]